MIKFYFSLIIVLFTATSFYQEDILLRGKIHTDFIEESSIHIINVNMQTGTTNSSSEILKLE